MTAAEIHEFRVGNIKCIAIQDENSIPPQGQIFKDVPLAERHLLPDEYDAPYELSYTCLLIDTGTQLILLDSGNGIDTGGEGRLLGNLAQIGVTAAAIDIVVLSHAHGDHYAGMVHESGAKVFPNAQYMMWRDEWLAYSNPEQLQRDRQGENGVARVAFIETYFLSLKPYLSFIDSDNPQIAPGVRAFYAPGHSHHHIGVIVESEGEQLLYVADAFVHPLFVPHPHWSFFFDVDAHAAEESRNALISYGRRHNALIATYHFPFPGLGHFVEKNGRVIWQDLGISH